MKWRRLDEQVVTIVKLKGKSFQEEKINLIEKGKDKEDKTNQDRSEDKTNGGQKGRGSQMT